MNRPLNRRRFVSTSAMAGTGAALAWPTNARGAQASAKPAALGGPPAHSGGFPKWPVAAEAEETALLGTLRSGRWFRGDGTAVTGFEEAYAKLTGAAHCVATSSGTSALTTALGALDIGPGDEVIIPPYTFVATYNVVVLNYALPIFVDSDLQSFQIDARKIEAAVTEETKAILPVHIGGTPADLDTILAAGNRHGIPVIEDACQAHLAEWRGRSVGTWGLAGCFSFQVSKNLSSGEGGAVLSNEPTFAEICAHFQDQGHRRAIAGPPLSHSGSRGSNLRMTEFQGSLLVAQMARLREQTERRTANAQRLTKLLSEIPGLHPAVLPDGVTRSAYHLYMFRYDPEAFDGLDREKFLSALSREGVPCSAGYGVMNKSEYVANLAKNRHYLKIYGEKRMEEWLERTRECPQNERLCREAVWFFQNLLLGTSDHMDQIAEAIRKIQKHAGELTKV